jgi:LacI family transcriptional regulator
VVAVETDLRVNDARWTPPTIRDVAARAGASLKTVSRVVNCEPGVSPAMERRVRDAIATLDYRPNLTASNLRRVGGRTRSIGLLLSNVGNPLDSGVQRAIELAALDRGFVVIGSTIGEDADREREIVNIFTARRVDGLVIMAAGHDQSYLAEQRRMRISMVFIDRPAAMFESDTVVVDNEAGSAHGVAHLVRHGHRRIGFLGAVGTVVTTEQRLAGYLGALQAADIEIEQSLIAVGIQGSEAAHEAAVRLMSGANPPTALFTGQNLITIGTVRALRQLDLHRRVALVGFDDIQLFDLLEPRLTVLAQDPLAIGRRAAETLFARLDGSTEAYRTDVIPVKLIERGSGEIPGPFAG